MKSSSCLAGSPSWIAQPLLRQPSEKRLRFARSQNRNPFKTMFRISWDLQQLSLSECVTHFLLRFWPSAQFAIAPKPFKVEVSCSNDNILLKSSEAATGGGAAEVRWQPGRVTVQQLHLGAHCCGGGRQEQGCPGWAILCLLEDGGVLAAFSRPGQCTLLWAASAGATRRSFPQCGGTIAGGFA